MAHANNGSEQIRVYTKKFDRFSFNKVLGRGETLKKQKELKEHLLKFESLGLLKLQSIIFCSDCGSDLTTYKTSMEGKAIECSFCHKTNSVDSHSNVQLMVFLTEKGKRFFRNPGWENLLEKG
ncbi:MAG: hypothetical protein ACE5OZ_08210 [Candidatus Heimdallarchaeota archaeon]